MSDDDILRTVYLSKTLDNKLRDLAFKLAISKNQLISVLIQEALKTLNNRENPNAQLLTALKACVAAMRKSRDVGCTDHLDCCDDGGQFWWDALETADKLISNRS